VEPAPRPASRMKYVQFPPSWPAVIFAIALIGLGVLVAMTQEALAPYIIALVLVLFMNGLVDRLGRLGLPRWAGTLIALLALIVGVVVFVYVILAAVIEQFVSLVTHLPEVSAAFREWLLALELSQDIYDAIANWTDSLLNSIPDFLPTVFGFVLSGVGGIVAFFVAVVGIPFWIFYALSDAPNVMGGLRQSVPAPFRKATFDMLGIVGNVFGAWGRGQVILSLSVAIPYFIAFTLMGWFIDPDIGKYALLFAVVLGLAEFVPIVGPVIAVIPILLITFAVAGLPGGLWVGGVFVVIEQLEGAVLIPRVQGSALNLHPVVILPALVVGSALLGLMGAVLALPVTASVRRLFAYLLDITSGESPDEEPAAAPAGSERPDAVVEAPAP
jgi:predicted PurR-regulated permease PerM